MRKIALLYFASCVVIASEEPVSIRLPQPYAYQGYIRVICKVPRNSENRGLTIGVENEQSSYRQLDGEDAVITHTLDVKHVGCDAGPAYCELKLASGKTKRVVQKFRVLGCQDDDGDGVGHSQY